MNATSSAFTKFFFFHEHNIGSQKNMTFKDCQLSLNTSVMNNYGLCKDGQAEECLWKTSYLRS